MHEQGIQIANWVDFKTSTLVQHSSNENGHRSNRFCHQSKRVCLHPSLYLRIFPLSLHILNLRSLAAQTAGNSLATEHSAKPLQTITEPNGCGVHVAREYFGRIHIARFAEEPPMAAPHRSAFSLSKEQFARTRYIKFCLYFLAFNFATIHFASFLFRHSRFASTLNKPQVYFN